MSEDLRTTRTEHRDPVIAVRGLRRVYGEGRSVFEAVRGIDLEVAEGEVFALLGTNGAGKTSTFDVLEGLAEPTAGEVRVFGRDPVRDRRQIRPYVGTMLQSGGLPAELTVAETLEMWRGTCSTPTTVDDVLERVGLTDRAGVRVAALSGGERRRVDLACALLGQPQLLFLDEPTTGLDPESRRGTWQLLSDLKAAGVTMVLTTHYLDEAEALADRIAIMHHGAIVTSGTLREIVDSEPATIRFDHPGLALPPLRDATVDAGARVTITTPDLQRHLSELLEWADDQRLRLTGLDARAASLESVFLRIAQGERTSATAAVPMGATA
ncbi:ABC transporter ATP-binding protein [Mumia sp. zg.B53]|uniref:ABC transporter ATP-binding protein n=1 Tax=unclassified Mumia TaxID=2621872 RepID=UPI001C6F54CA|nr:MULTISPECIES: ABC transporter ATP-binding protein [unclassified Mumia]MBW9208244.1 ABC transporter ATP-binding protein [Mumia sp. zg.B21]MBW9216200.1 ABC transporter ATP-binding protein [Mumia sp. zg.B53]